MAIKPNSNITQQHARTMRQCGSRSFSSNIAIIDSSSNNNKQQQQHTSKQKDHEQMTVTHTEPRAPVLYYLSCAAQGNEVEMEFNPKSAYRVQDYNNWQIL